MLCLPRYACPILASLARGYNGHTREVPMTPQFLLRCSLSMGLGLSMFAQTTRPPSPGTGGPGGTGGTPTRTVPGRPGKTSPFPSPTTTTPYPDMPRPLFLAGKVMMDDGTPPPDSVVIQLACNALPRNVGFTDRKGGFSVDLNNRMNNSLYGDASQTQDSDSVFGNMSGSNNSRAPQGSGGGMRTGGPMSERDLMGCDLQASLPGFRSDAVHLGTHRSMDNPDVGIIFLHRLANVEGLTISATSTMAPKDAQKALEKGRNDAKKGKFEDAQRELEKAVTIYPKYAAAWFTLGQIQEARKDVEGARKSYAQALAADGKFVSPYQQLALLAAREQKWQDVVDGTNRLLHLNPLDFPQARLFNSLANYNPPHMDAPEH